VYAPLERRPGRQSAGERLHEAGQQSATSMLGDVLGAAPADGGGATADWRAGPGRARVGARGGWAACGGTLHGTVPGGSGGGASRDVATALGSGARRLQGGRRRTSRVRASDGLHPATT